MQKEELYINGERIELIESLNPSLTFNVADIAKPDTRKADYSKTITLPGSKKLNKQFEHIFEVNLSLQTFNPNLKTDVIYLVDGEINLDGYLQLKQVNILDNDKVTYDCTIVGRLGDFVTTLGDKELTDLDLSALNHTYTKANQSGTWNLPLTTDYVYPMIDYGTHYDWTDWGIQDFFPAITAKKYLDTIFSDAGYSYDSTFLNSTFFKTLIVPFSSKDFALSTTQINNRIFNANTTQWNTSGSADYTINETAVQIYQNPQADQILFTNEVSDVGNVYNNTTGVYTVAENGFYNINFDVDLNVEFAPTGASEDTTSICALVGFIEIRNYAGGGGTYTVLDSKNVSIVYNGTIASGGTGTTSATPTFPDNDYKASGTTNITNVGVPGAFTSSNNHYFNPPNKYIAQATNVLLSSTDEIKIYGSFFLAPIANQSTGKLFEGTSGAFYTGTATVKLISGTFRNQVVNNGYVEGNTIDMNGAIPLKIKQKDFFMSLVKMFNLYVQTDTANDRNLFIEPRDDFYNSNVNNWAQKLDISQPLEFLPMGALDSREYMYSYKSDKDYYNELYNETWGEIYGEREYSIENDFLKNQYKTEVVFSPTPSKGIIDNDRIIPSIIKTDDNGQAQRTEANIRILQWAGLKSTQNIWEHKDSSGATVKTTYPYAGHYDDPYTPTVDINFGLTKEIYWDDTYNAITFTNNNLFNKYHRKFIEEITDVNSKIVKGWFYLKPGDIRKLSFREQYYFDGAYFRLYKVENYNPSNPLTKCEFLKIKDAEVFVPSTTISNGGVLLVATNEPAPKFMSGSNLLKQGNSYASELQEIKGEDNYISRNAKYIEVYGDGNKVYSDTNNIKISGDNNVVNSGLKNVSLINTNNQTVTSSNVTYVNGELKGDGSVVTITSATTAEESVTTYLVDTSSANVLVSLPTDVNIGKVWNVKLIDATNACTLRCAGRTIDGNATELITRLNTCISVQYDGLNYNII
jgi:hypothetical protein